MIYLVGAGDIPQKVKNEVEAAVSEKYDVVPLKVGLCSLLNLCRETKGCATPGKTIRAVSRRSDG